MKKLMKTLLMLAVTAMMTLCMSVTYFSAGAAGTAVNEKWICAWGTAPTQIGIEGFSNIAAFVGDITARTVITPTASGSKLRVRVSNYYGEEPLKIESMTVAKSTGKSTIDPNSIKVVTFNQGSPSITVPAGKEYYSDPVVMDVQAQQDIAISTYVSEYQDISTMGLCGADSYLTTGDATRVADLDLLKGVIDNKEALDIINKLLGGSLELNLAYSFIKVVPCLTSVDVLSNDAGYSVVVVGDSTVSNEFPLYLSQSIYEEDNITNVGIVGKGIIGNRLLGEGLGYGSLLFGESMIDRMQRDVLSQSGVEYVIVKIGANDIMHPVCIDIKQMYPGIKQPTAQELIEGFRRVFKLCHDAGVKVIAVSITQWKGNTRDYLGTGGKYIRTDEEFEADWRIAQKVNEWLSTTTEHDGYVNLVDISANPLDPDAFLPEYTIDGAHPSDELQRLWGNYFPHSLLGIGNMPGGVKLDKSEILLYINESQRLKAEVYPSTTPNKEVEWYSEDPLIATVDDNGLVKAVSNGVATIVCRTKAGGFIAKCYATVKTKPESVALNKTSATLITTQTLQLAASVLPETASNKRVVWSSSDEKVATVDDKGLVTAVGRGTAVITVKTVEGSATAKCTLTVNKKIEVLGISIDQPNIAIYKGKTATLTAEIEPSNATVKTVKWTTSNKNVATVSQSGVVTGVGAGTAVIKCASVDNPMMSVTCEVKVYIRTEDVTLSRETAKIYETKSFTLKATIYPADATNKRVTWTSSDTSVATVDANGKVTGVRPGVATITCKTVNSSRTATCQVTVVKIIKSTSVKLDKTSLTLKDGYSAFLEPTVYPANTTVKTVKWTSSNTKVATVSADGEVYAVYPGTAVITCTTADTGKTAKCKVTVTEVKPTSVAFAYDSISVDANKVVSLKYTVLPKNATDQTVKFSTSDSSIVQVSQTGKVKGLKPGKSAVITVKTVSGGKVDKITVKVKAVPVSKVSLNTTSVVLGKGRSYQLTANVQPSNATVKTVTWSSSNTKVATVDSKGLIKAVGNGTAYITCKTKSGGLTAKCKVVVKTIKVMGVTLDKSSVKADLGVVFTIKATVIPANATNKKVVWSTSDPKVATVTSSGKVTCVGKGLCEIKCKTVDGGYVDVCKLYVK
ncbi:MAG: Ig-like domain-containing protein [Oscillospiraceae bacterium]|nr:Ig-like domain-containing protein [Oscillospiraceae bacterium]